MGAAKVSRSQSEQTAIGHEAGVADAMAVDVERGGTESPAFFFHLGDVVYRSSAQDVTHDSITLKLT
jgi:hypothetical protein